MKRILIAVAALVLLFASSAYALDLQAQNGYTNTIGTLTFNTTINETNSSSALTLWNSKTAFFVTYTETLANQSITVVPQVSQDGTTYINQSFYIVGNDTAQTTLPITANGTSYFSLLPQAVAPYSRINAVSVNNTDGNTTSLVTYIVGSINQKW